MQIKIIGLTLVYHDPLKYYPKVKKSDTLNASGRFIAYNCFNLNSLIDFLSYAADRVVDCVLNVKIILINTLTLDNTVKKRRQFCFITGLIKLFCKQFDNKSIQHFYSSVLF